MNETKKKITNAKKEVTVTLKDKTADKKDIQNKFEVPEKLGGLEIETKDGVTFELTGVKIKVKKGDDKDFVEEAALVTIKFRYKGGYLYDEIEIEEVNGNKVEKGDKLLSAYSGFLAWNLMFWVLLGVLAAGVGGLLYWYFGTSAEKEEEENI